MQFPQYKNKKVLIFGLGLNDGGLGMVDFFAAQGSQITVTDGKTEEQLATTLDKLRHYGDQITYHLGGHVESDFTDNDLIIRNPAIKPDNPYLEIARKAGKPIEMEISLFMKLAPCQIVGISGTRGKSTTTTLTYLFLHKEFGNRLILAGNIGKSAIRELPTLTKANIVVLEISSFQLDAMREAHQSPQYSLLTNIYDDHLNWHRDIDDYIDAKFTLFTFQKKGDFGVVNVDDPRAKNATQLVNKTGANLVTFSSLDKNASYYRNSLDIFEEGEKLLSLETMLLDGEHNYHNVLGAIALVRQFRVSVESILSVLTSFTGVEGRQQLISEINGVKIYNDTTATSLEAMIVAMQRFGPKHSKKIILISGGMEKGADYSTIVPYWEKHAKAIILLEGTASEKMAQFMEKSSVPVHKYFGIFAEAISKAHSLAESGDMIILCPGAASFNMFANEFDRGRQFNSLVSDL